MAGGARLGSGSSDAPWGLPRLHVVTDHKVLRSRGFLAGARAVLRAGGPQVALHLRGPGWSGRDLFALGMELAGEVQRTGSLLVVNDRIDVAVACGAGGVQLGGRSLSPADARAALVGTGPVADRPTMIGASVHGTEEGLSAWRAGADYLVVGSVFITPSHPDRRPGGVRLVSELVEATCSAGEAPPVIGIGGITPDLAVEVVEAGGWGVAVISGIWGASDPADAVSRFLRKLLDRERGM